ncbi:MAG TPA: hypothetical protein VK563_13655 [Puia sp.]|nr:hypothetical protein [Puia sp.]
MRSVIFISLFILGLSSGRKNITIGSNPLNGTWAPVSQEMGGKSLPKAAFETQRLVISDSNYVFTAESVDKGVVKYQDNKMDIYGKEGVNTGKHFTAIFKYENELLTICYNLSGDGYPETFDTNGKPLFFLSVFKREMAR